MVTTKKPTKSKDLPPKKTTAVKGGRIMNNDNLTLVRVR